MRRASANTVLEVEDLRTIFHTREGAVYAVNGVSFELRSGELLGVVGESGSGKSVTRKLHGWRTWRRTALCFARPRGGHSYSDL